MHTLRSASAAMVLLQLAGGLAAGIPAAAASETPLLDDLPADTVAKAEARIAEGIPPLQAVRESAMPFLFDAGDVLVRTDPRWFQSLPASGPAAPMLELRRWPGDTIVTFYAVAPPPVDQPDASPPLPPGRFEGPTDLAQGFRQWRGQVDTPSGPRPAYWVERPVADGAPSLGALLLPGDAGLGAAAVAHRAEEAAAVAYSAQLDAGLWRSRPPIPRDRTLDLPLTGPPPGDQSEADSPWQVIAAGDFSLGLPPGFRARRADAGVPAPRPLPGQQLWLRGVFTDMQGEIVRVGDGAHAGYVARLEAPSAEWKKGVQAPLGAVGGQSVRGERFTLLEDRTGARSARAERWHDPSLTGEWLLFRLVFEDHGFEIGLPVLEGRQSESLFWIPASWRKAGEAPAPPPVDPAARFGIRFERLTASGRRERPWSEGFLETPGLRAEFPKGHWPSASLRSSDGFPIRIVDREGELLGRIERIDADSVAGFAPDQSGWTEEPKAAAFRAERAYRRAGELLVISAEGHGYRFVEAEELGDRADWWTRMLDSIRLKKPGR